MARLLRPSGGMLGKNVLLYTADRVASRPISGCLRAAGNEVVVVSDADAAINLIAARAVDLVLFDHAVAWDLNALAWAAAGSVPFVVLAGDYDAAVLREVFCHCGIAHLIGRGEQGQGLAGIDLRDVVVTVEKILQNDIFGAGKYLPDFGVDLANYEIRGASDRDELLECVQDYLRWLGAGRDVVDAMGLVVDELVTNAVYNAPRDEHGQPRYAAVDRRQKIQLDPWEHASVEFGSDGRTFVFSISDNFGGLTMERIRERLHDCLSDGDQIEQKDGGAGLGLYTVLQSVSQLIVNVEPGKRTEVVVVIELGRKARAERSGHTLQLFTHHDQHAETQDEESVVVSQELRSELLTALAPQRRRGQVVALVEPKRQRRTPRRLETEESGLLIV